MFTTGHLQAIKTETSYEMDENGQQETMNVDDKDLARINNDFDKFCTQIKQNRLLPVIWPTVLDLAKEIIKKKIERLLPGSYEEFLLDEIKEWKETVVDSWLSRFFFMDGVQGKLHFIYLSFNVVYP